MSDFASQLQIQQAAQTARKLPDLNGARKLEQMRGKAQEFEAVFLSQMLQPMFEGLDAEEPFGGGPSEQMWRSLMVDEYGKSMARAGGIGIADRVMQEMLKAQEARH